LVGSPRHPLHIDVRNNNITEKTIEDFNNLNVNNVNNNNITMLSGETGAISNENNAISNENNVNDTWQDSNKNEWFR
jgi:hypothetical protein